LQWQPHCTLENPAFAALNENMLAFNCVYVQKVLPAAPGGSQPLPEGLLWLLLTGQVPTEAQVRALSKDLMARSEVPPHVDAMLKALPKNTHPMTQFSMAIMALQPASLFATGYAAGAQLWSSPGRPRPCHMSLKNAPRVLCAQADQCHCAVAAANAAGRC
jgi:citrate synthase